jgi:hypothetical protein
MTRVISNDDMANVRQSLAQAGIYFDKLYINQVAKSTTMIAVKYFYLFRLISIVILLYKHRMTKKKNHITIFGINYSADQVSFWMGNNLQWEHKQVINTTNFY